MAEVQLFKLFGIDLRFQSDLDLARNSPALQQAFSNNGSPISENSSVTVKERGSEWFVSNNKGDISGYIIRKEGGELSINVRRSPLYEYFRLSVEVLRAEYKRSKNLKANANLGANRELFCSRFLSWVLPSRLTCRSGEILDSDGKRTGQLDLVILLDDAPKLTFGGIDLYLAEGVFAVIEVKSRLYSEELEGALKTLKRVKSLYLRSTLPFFPINKILCCVFAYEGMTGKTLLNKLNDSNNQGVADLVCILNRGICVSKGLGLETQDNEPYIWHPGKTAALALLYYHLVLYSTRLRMREMNIQSYFTPLVGWADDDVKK